MARPRFARLNLYRIYVGAQRDYHLAYIPVEFDEAPTEDFDPTCMRALFDLGYEMARGGYPWAESPPGFLAE